MTDVVDGVVVAEDEIPQQDLVPYDAAPANIFGASSPAETVKQAIQYADALADVIQRRQLFKMISGKPHVLVEGWTLLGSMLGVFPIVVWTRRMENGWEARVEVRTRDGAVVGAAEAQCTREENMWSDTPTSSSGKRLPRRDDYALRSMAQTRATSKALRGPLGFIVQLAGFSPTPEAEIPHDSPDPPPAADTQGTAPKATKQQHAKHNALLAELEAKQPRLEGAPTWEQLAREWCKEEFGKNSRSLLTKQEMGKLIEWTDDMLKVPF